MNLLHSVQMATHIYMKLAYPEGASDHVNHVLHGLEDLHDDKEFLAWSELEQEEDRFLLRLGNEGYPHMKLVFLLEEGQPVFYVDAHDSHFDLPAVIEMSDSLRRLRERNKRTKQRIEAALASERLAVFGMQFPKPKANQKGSSLKVMAIDDEIQILDMLGLIVTRMGSSFQSALSVANAKEQFAEQGLPDIIFCDIMMPGESGYEFVSWLAKEGHQVPVYFITGLNLEKVDRNGVVDVLQKPFKAKRLMEILRELDPRVPA